MRRISLNSSIQSIFEVVKINKKGEHVLDARGLVTAMKLLSPQQIDLTIRQTDKLTLKPAEIIKGVFFLREDDLLNMKILKTEQVYQ